VSSKGTNFLVLNWNESRQKKKKNFWSLLLRVKLRNRSKIKLHKCSTYTRQHVGSLIWHRLFSVQLSCVPICEISKSFKNQILMQRNVDYYLFYGKIIYGPHLTIRSEVKLKKVDFNYISENSEKLNAQNQRNLRLFSYHDS
jgi:hypothetical protein